MDAIAQGEEVLLMRFEAIDTAAGEARKPRLATQDGVPARIEFGQEGGAGCASTCCRASSRPA